MPRGSCVAEAEAIRRGAIHGHDHLLAEAIPAQAGGAALQGELRHDLGAVPFGLALQQDQRTSGGGDRTHVPVANHNYDTACDEGRILNYSLYMSISS